MLVQTHQPAPQKPKRSENVAPLFCRYSVSTFTAEQAGAHLRALGARGMCVGALISSDDEDAMEMEEPIGWDEPDRAARTADGHSAWTHRTVMTLLHPRSCPLPLGNGIITH